MSIISFKITCGGINVSCICDFYVSVCVRKSHDLMHFDGGKEHDFLIDAVINCHRLGDFKQHTFIFLKLVPEANNLKTISVA